MSTYHRRGGEYTRNGKRFVRRGSNVAYSPALVWGGATLSVGILYGAGIPIVASAGIVAGGLVCWKYRRQLGRMGRRARRATNRLWRRIRRRATPAQRKTRPAYIPPATKLALRQPPISRGVTSKPARGGSQPKPAAAPAPHEVPPNERPHVIKLDRPAPGGWRAGDRQCSQHRTGYNPACPTCKSAVRQHNWARALSGLLMMLSAILRERRP
jgi:hypothetical protein